ncbi:MAG: hypothetical protein HQL74_01185 [Magnetococcales bacterium]|nr:hypothetical protein [Magnetococcales bacterium]
MKVSPQGVPGIKLRIEYGKIPGRMRHAAIDPNSYKPSLRIVRTSRHH